MQLKLLPRKRVCCLVILDGKEPLKEAKLEKNYETVAKWGKAVDGVLLF